MISNHDSAGGQVSFLISTPLLLFYHSVDIDSAGRKANFRPHVLLDSFTSRKNDDKRLTVDVKRERRMLLIKALAGFCGRSSALFQD